MTEENPLGYFSGLARALDLSTGLPGWGCSEVVLPEDDGRVGAGSRSGRAERRLRSHDGLGTGTAGGDSAYSRKVKAAQEGTGSQLTRTAEVHQKIDREFFDLPELAGEFV